MLMARDLKKQLEMVASRDGWRKCAGRARETGFPEAKALITTNNKK
jgi:hypothetical protein